MKIEETWSYDAPADRVFEMLLDPKFQQAKCEATGALSSTVDVRTEPPVEVIETRREMSTAGLPDNVAKIVGKSLKIIEIQLWGQPEADGVRTADLDVSLGGLPVNYVGKLTMTPQGATTTMHLVGDLKARIPLVGGRVESAAAPAISNGVRIEAETGARYLA
ncbi:DUF2505 domain-containing protein [Flexivirga sp. ID2601S]|uniref:DUF2505 domain-containing protein n=1 Tax=Flexivirga aerilata TaxID=1656889 RepID=A0A849AK86_9MICO|nr:DUF2505 domain-containing protein [Flexivirga aerilata]